MCWCWYAVAPLRADGICCAHRGSISHRQHLPQHAAQPMRHQPLLMVATVPREFPFLFLLWDFPSHVGKSASARSRDGGSPLKRPEDHEVVPFLSCPPCAVSLTFLALVWRSVHLRPLLPCPVRSRSCDRSPGTTLAGVGSEKSTIHTVLSAACLSARHTGRCESTLLLVIAGNQKQIESRQS